MGWKTLKDTLEIEHHVQITAQGVCIGSGYIHDLVVINPRTGELRESSTFPGFVDRYCPKLREATPELIMHLLAEPDSFSESIPVYTFEGSCIVEKWCEKPGWPNVTHDGCMMHEDAFSTDRDEVVAWAKRRASKEIDQLQSEVVSLKSSLANKVEKLNHAKAVRGKLEAQFPAYRFEPDKNAVGCR